MLKRFLVNRSGATSIEYALLALVIATVLIASMTSIGQSLLGIFARAAAGFGGG
jgi:pilus assembly protein Flp/PilA